MHCSCYEAVPINSGSSDLVLSPMISEIKAIRRSRDRTKECIFLVHDFKPLQETVIESLSLLLLHDFFFLFDTLVHLPRQKILGVDGGPRDVL